MHVPIDWLIIHLIVLIPEGLRILVRQAEAPTYGFWQSVDVVVRHLSDEVDDLIFEHDLPAVSVKDRLASHRTHDSELKGGLGTFLGKNHGSGKGK